MASASLLLAEHVKDFMQEIFTTQLDHRDQAKASIPKDISNELLEDCYLAVDILTIAFKNETPWTLEELRQWRRSGRKGTLLPAQLLNSTRDGGAELLVDRPCSVRDSDGRVFCYVLPGMLSARRQSQLQEAVYDLCDSYHKPFTIVEDGRHWRTAKGLYKDKDEQELRMEPGAACYSPCWYEQGHPDKPPGPSMSLINAVPNLQLLRDTQEVMALMGGILSIIHPALFKRGMDVWETAHDYPWDFRNGERVEEILKIWASPFTAMSLISNRETPLHRDLKGGRNFFDAILTFGNYEEGRFQIPEAGLRFRYESGTVVFLESRSLEHGASPVLGERCCMVFFFRPLMVRYDLGDGEKDPEGVPMPTIEELRVLIRGDR